VFRFLLHPLAFVILVTLLIWLAVIVYWQETVRLVTAEDVAIYLIGLPVLAIALGFGLRAAYRRSTRKEPPAPQAAASAAAPAAATDEAERSYALALLAVGVAGAAGDSAGATYQALKARELQPTPDAELRNRDGFPVHACRVKQLDTQEIEATLAALDASACAPGVLRALTLLDQSLTPVLDKVAAAAPDPAARPKTTTGPMPRLFVDLLLPADWHDRSRALAARHIGNLIGEAGWPAAICTVNVLAAADGSLALRQLDAFSLKANRAGSSDFYLLAGCDSAIDEDLVSTLESSGRLFGSGNGQGLIPGEAAAAMLAQVPQKMTTGSAVTALVGRAALAVRAKSADEVGRIGHETLLEIGQHCLVGAQLQPADIALVVSDADQRSSRCGECMGAINSLLPELDPAADFIGTGQALGRVGCGGGLVALAVAAAAVEDEDKPVLLTAVSHPTERAAVIVRPYVAPAQPAPAVN
jgi:hypothetical protein